MLAFGRLQQNAGESPIDNLQLPNLMLRQDALLLTVGHRSLAELSEPTGGTKKAAATSLGGPKIGKVGVCAHVYIYI